MKLSIIIINYNDEYLIRKNLSSLKQWMDTEIIVVNNSRKPLKLSEPNISIINNRKNLGFSKAANIGIEKSNGEYVLMLNPDVIMDKELNKMIDFMEENKDIGILACKLLNKDGTIQDSCRRFPKISEQILNLVMPNSDKVKKYLMRDFDHNEIREVDWVTGAFMLIRKKLFKEMGGFNEKFFLYMEDLELCLRAKKKNWKTVYYPHISFTHYYKRESKNIMSIIQFHHIVSMIKFYSKSGLNYYKTVGSY